MNEFEGDGVEFITGDFDALIDEAMSKHSELLKRLADGDRLDTAREAYEASRTEVETRTVDMGEFLWDAAQRRYDEAAHKLVVALEAAIAAQVERTRAVEASRESYEAAKLMANTPHKDIDLRLRLRWEADAATAYTLALEADNKRLSNERELLLRYGRSMLADMTKEGLSSIAMMQMKAVLDKDADHD